MKISFNLTPKALNMFKYLLSFFWALPAFLLYYQLNNEALTNIHEDLYERFNFILTGGLSLYSYIYFISDYIIINLTFFGLISAIKRKETLTHRTISIISGLSVISTILCHKYLLQIDLIASYYTLSFLISAFSFVYIIIKRKGALVSNFLITITSFALYLFIGFIHFLYIYYNLHHTEEVLYKEDRFTFQLIQESINNGTFARTSENLNIKFEYKNDFFKNENITGISESQNVTAGVTKMVSHFEGRDDWSASFITLEYDIFRANNHSITKVSKNENGYPVQQYLFKIESVYPIYGQFFFVIYCSILAFSTVWLCGLFKLISIHRTVYFK